VKVISQYKLEPLRKDGEFILYRGVPREGAEANQNAILALSPLIDHPAPATVKKLEHEFALKDELDPAWAVRPITLTQQQGRALLLFEAPNGEPLDRLVGQPLEMRQFLRIGIALAGSLGHVHRRGLVHKDIRPANVFSNGAMDQAWLTGFGIASRLPRERRAPEPPELIVGTLAYMAPEQTGRMNRSIDSRSDLYAFGVTLYELLTGSPPFSASDPMEWVHCHIARPPLSPAEQRPDIPYAVSAIVLKLLAKTPEERYQTAAGVESDLGRCLEDWEGQCLVRDFPLGQDDKPDRLVISEKLYGREHDVETLLASFDRVVEHGRPELVLISGYSGIGKSSLVNELHKSLVPPRGLFASGKFDQLKRDVPYATVAQALRTLIRQLLGKSEDELSRWRDQLRQALDPNGGLVTDLIPELKYIIGEQAAVPDVAPAATKVRFQMALRGLIGVFARAEHPLALFLDDLQWLDAATLDLLESILIESEPQHLLLVGAYRDNEVDAAHPLMRKLSALRRSGVVAQEVVLGPLTQEDLTHWFADALQTETECARPLANLVHTKTGGNPFFASQVLHELVDDDLLTFESADCGWRWNIEAIQAKGYTENVVGLMVGKLNRLALTTQEALKALACLGNRAESSTLAMIHGTTEEQLHSHLWDALLLELVVRADDSYRFVHDRVQEAAYALVPVEQRAAQHLRIGRLLASQTESDQREEAVFEIAGHFNRAADLLVSQKEREGVAALNLAAGKRAKKAAAFVSALNYLTAGADLVAAEWRRHDLVFELELHRAECEYLTGEVTAAEQRLTNLSARASSITELAAVVCLQADVYFALQKPERGVWEGAEFLRQAGYPIPLGPTELEARAAYDTVYSRLEGLGIDEIAALPLMTDPTSRATLDVLAKISPCAATTNWIFDILCTCAAVSLTLEHGTHDASCRAFSVLGYLAAWRYGNFEASFRISQIGYQLVERTGLRRFEGFVCLTFSTLVLPWAKHVVSCRPVIHRTFEVAHNTGDRFWAVESCPILLANLLMAGDSLVEVEQEAESRVAFCRSDVFSDYTDTVRTQLALTKNLRGRTRRFGSLDDDQFDELQIENHFLSDPHVSAAECWYWIRKMQARFLAGDYIPALDAARRAQGLLHHSPGMVERIEHEFYCGLTHAAHCESLSGDGAQQHLEAIAAHHREIENWARYCPENFENRAALLAAEIARIEARDYDAIRLYEHAIQSARKSGFVNSEAVAYERAAAFYRARGFDQFADVYMRSARACYATWGADGKVRQLDRLHPHLKQYEGRPDPSRTVEAPVEQLDLPAVLKVLQAVSGEIDLEKLIGTVMRLGLEHAGADRGLLVLPRGSDYRVEAEAGIGNEGVTVTQRGSSVTGEELPESALNFVLRTSEAVLLHDASVGNSFSGDAYIRQRRPRSLLCMPLVKQTRLVGVLYLENSLTPGAFSPDRMILLKLLASEAAISIENARLYRDLQERDARFRRLIDANIIGIFIFHADGRVFDANDEFLRIVGYSREDLVSGRLRWTAFTMPESIELDSRLLEELQKGAAMKSEERELVRKDGTRVPVLAGGTMFDGAPDEGVAFVIDLTELRRVERALHESRHEARLVVETIPGMVAILTPAAEVEAVNRQLVEYCGQPLEAMRQWSTNGTIHSEDLSRITRAFTHSGASGEPYDFEARLRRFDGAYRWFQVRGLPLHDTSGEIVRWYVLLSDIDDRKRAESELRQLHERFVDAQRLAALNTLTASIAHEVNQPLSGILTNTGTCIRMLNSEPPDVDGARTTVKRAIRDCQRASDVITRLRAMFSKKEFRLESVDLNDATREVVALSMNDLQRNRVVLHLELADPLPTIMGDRIQLQQVILNLLRNASDAMAAVEDRPRHMVVKTETDGESRIRVTVQDAGVGLPQESVGKLFDAFFTTKQGGMGIGLSVSRSIIERHHGRMWAQPNDGPGATFAFSIPVGNEAPTRT